MTMESVQAHYDSMRAAIEKYTPYVDMSIVDEAFPVLIRGWSLVRDDIPSYHENWPREQEGRIVVGDSEGRMCLIDPDTGEVLPDGSQGELVFTSLDKEAFPLLRYRTRDV